MSRKNVSQDKTNQKNIDYFEKENRHDRSVPHHTTPKQLRFAVTGLTNVNDNEGCSKSTVLDVQSPNLSRRADMKYIINSPDKKYNQRKSSVELCQQWENKLLPGTADQELKYFNSSVQQPQIILSPSRLDVYCHLKYQGTLIKEALRAEAERQNTSLETLQELQKEEFIKAGGSSTVAQVIKMQANRLDSVGYIMLNNKRNTEHATCFLLGGSYILTCYHVIQMIVGDWVDEKDWPEVLSEVARVTFVTEEEQLSQKNTYYWIDSSFAITEKCLNYALLKLQRNPDPSRRRLIKPIPTEPSKGLFYAIGQRKSHKKTIKTCIVVPFINRHGEELFYLFSPSSDRDRTSAQVPSYNTIDLRDFAGAPVFDSSGHLVAVLSATYDWVNKYKHCSMIYFGWSRSKICSDIESKDKKLYDLLLQEDLNNDSEWQDVNMDSQNSVESMEVEYYGHVTKKRKHRSSPE